VFLVSEIEAVALTGVFQWCGSIDEKHGVIDVVFLAELAKEGVGENVCSGRWELCVEHLFISGSTAAYSQYRSSLSRITVSPTAT
jgi:hypothetical protein